MYVDIVPNRSSPPAVLLRESWREDGKVHKRTLANISHWSWEKVQTLRRLLRDEKLVPAEGMFRIEASLPHGHMAAILATLRAIGLERMIAPRRSRERDLVVAMIAQQLLHAGSKLADTRLWQSSCRLHRRRIQSLYGSGSSGPARATPIGSNLSTRRMDPCSARTW